MADYAHSIQELIDAFGRLPGIGPKSAQRITFHLLKVDKAESQRLVSAISSAVEKVSFCTRCYNLAEGDLCAICSDDQRDAHQLCVVEEPRDVVAIERTREYRGLYHVLRRLPLPHRRPDRPPDGHAPRTGCARQHRRRGHQ